MSLKDIPKWRETVAAKWRETTAYVLSLSEPCITIRAGELRAIRDNRVLVALDAAAFKAWKPPTGSWFMAVILCPEDSLEPLIEWVRRHGVETGRIHFYVHREEDLGRFMEVWAAEGFPTDAVDSGIRDWRQFHQLFGLHLSNQILVDALKP